MNRAPVLVIVLAALLAVGLIGFFSLFERREITVPAQAKGQAKYNRFFALERTLAKLDIPVSSVATLSPSASPTGSTAAATWCWRRGRRMTPRIRRCWKRWAGFHPSAWKKAATG